MAFAGRAHAPSRRAFAMRHSLLQARALAAMLDLAAVLAPALGGSLALALASPVAMARAVELLSAPSFALALSYFYLCEARDGRTLGKRALGLRVRDETGAPASLGAVCLRTLMRPLDAFFLTGLLAALMTGGRVGDWLAGTTVVFDGGIPLAPACRLSWRLAWFPLLLGIAATVAALFA